MPTTTVNGIRLHYELAGEGPSLLLIHGLGSSAADWERQLPALSAHYRVIAPDLRGHGHSQRPAGPWTMGDFADDLLGLLDQLGVDQAHVLGLSLGGGIAFQLAVQAPARLRSLIIVNSGPELVPRSLRERLVIWQRYAIVWLLGLRRMGSVLAVRLFPGDAELQRSFVERFAANDRRSYLNALRAFVGWSVAEHLGSITCPTLVIAADQDYTPVSLKREYTARIPNAELVVLPDSHHAVPAERPELFNDCLRRFLDRASTA
jgi:3-oxoadipate enol-lactonase